MYKHILSHKKLNARAIVEKIESIRSEQAESINLRGSINQKNQIRFKT